MDPKQKKVALRAITYGLCVLTARYKDELAAAGVNWLTQASFEPPLIVVACKNDNETTRLIKSSSVLALGVLGEAQLRHRQGLLPAHQSRGRHVEQLSVRTRAGHGLTDHQ